MPDRRGFLKAAALAAGGGYLAAGTARAEERPGARGDQYAMLNDCTRCVGCRACQTACKRSHDLEKSGADALHETPTDLNARNLTLIELYKESDTKWSFVKKQCMHCGDASCVSVCIAAAFRKREDGVVDYDPGKCIGCRYCQYACPFNVPTFEYERAAPVIRKCDFCKDIRLAKGEQPWCADVCPVGAIKFGKRSALLREAHARIDGEPNRYASYVYGEKELGGTSVLYLAPKEMGFEKFGFPAYDEATPFHLQEDIQHGIFKYWAPPVALYAGLALIAYSSGRRPHAPADDSKEGA
jgi:Fe-S-cluster-containing dehydrogenase component